jgi:hypothetical protein
VTRRPERAELSLRGIVIATAWDAEGAPRAIALATPGEADYPILPDQTGARLIWYVRSEVLVRGRLVDQGQGPTLEVHSFEPIAHAADMP